MLAITKEPTELIRELAKRVSYSTLANELYIPEHAELLKEAVNKRSIERLPKDILARLFLYSNVRGFFDLLPPHGVPPVSYNLDAPFDIDSAPLGYHKTPPLLPLLNKPTKIGGFPVDFPLGLPASVLAANSKWIAFYARRGFDILTYKTVRTQQRREHMWPNWVFLKDPREILPSEAETVVGYPRYLPEDLVHISMANSFGVPSLSPEWWQEDIRRARGVVKAGQQVLIVSVISSVEGDDIEEIAQDYVKAAVLAKEAGADIIEANYSCPNVVGDEVGDIFHYPERAGRVSRIIKTALKEKFKDQAPPLFIKIGYLPKQQLREFVEHNVEFLDGIVAINTISAKVVDDKGQHAFPGGRREKAGVSGWAIQARAKEVLRDLVSLREEYTKDFTILGLGGVLTKQDVFEYLDIGVDGVESCTGALLNPLLGLETRLDVAAMSKTPSLSEKLAFELKFLGKFLEDAFLHPTKPSHIRTNRKTGDVVVDRDLPT